jgi:hypothetical protein
MGGLGPAIVFGAQATDFGVFNLVKNEDCVNDRNLMLHLDLRQGVRDAPTDVLRVAGFTLENNSETNQGGITT